MAAPTDRHKSRTLSIKSPSGYLPVTAVLMSAALCCYMDADLQTSASGPFAKGLLR